MSGAPSMKVGRVETISPTSIQKSARLIPENREARRNSEIIVESMRGKDLNRPDSNRETVKRSRNQLNGSPHAASRNEFQSNKSKKRKGDE
jgi:hypothetical protein